MEQHAVPQDITGFKFKLVGDMTLKQFGELAAGAILAYLFYVSNWHPFLKWPFVIFFGIFGSALAFLPVEERPLDVWILNFFRAIYRPTLYIWQKDTGKLAFPKTTPQVAPLKMTDKAIPGGTPTSEPGLGVTPWPFPKTQPAVSPPPAKSDEEKEETVLPKITEEEPKVDQATEKPVQKEMVKPAAPVVTKPTIPTPTRVVVPEEKPNPLPVQSVDQLQKFREEKLKELERAKNELKEATVEAKKEVFQAQVAPNAITVDQLAKMREEKVGNQDQASLQKIAADQEQLNGLVAKNQELTTKIEALKNQIGSSGGNPPPELFAQLEQLNSQKSDLGGQINKLSEELAAMRVAPLSKPSYENARPKMTATGAKVVPKMEEKLATISLTEIPNVINGIILTDKGGPIEGVIVVIKDTTGNSIRALKTNSVGQFLVSTPLENGTYYLEMEKTGYSFEMLEIKLTGQVLVPLEIRAALAS